MNEEDEFKVPGHGDDMDEMEDDAETEDADVADDDDPDAL